MQKRKSDQNLKRLQHSLLRFGSEEVKVRSVKLIKLSKWKSIGELNLKKQLKTVKINQFQINNIH